MKKKMRRGSMCTPVPDTIKDTTWTNMGDASPREHGGRFIKWDDYMGYWLVVETVHVPTSIGPEAVERMDATYLILEYAVGPSDVWRNPECMEDGFTTGFARALEPLGAEDTDPVDADAVFREIPFAAPEMFHGKDFYTHNYWQKLDDWGIRPRHA